MRRDHWQAANDSLDPERDWLRIYRQTTQHEFPWDMNQALSFALFRTYAVPGVGQLLDATQAFATQTQKRYDDTGLLLEQPLAHGFDDPRARAALRRVNQMHRSYDIPDHEMRYVLSTFVVVPVRWLDAYGKRSMTEGEVRASVLYYRELGRHLNIPDLPQTYAGFERLMDDYEAEHFAYTRGARRVADATLALMVTFYPRPAARVVEAFSRALMDERLRRALGYEAPPAWFVRASRAALRGRGRLLRLFPARRRPKRVEDLSWVRTYGGARDFGAGDIAAMGTFPVPGAAGCPVRHTGPEGAAVRAGPQGGAPRPTG